MSAEKKTNYWIHRISHEWEVSYPLLDKGYLSAGWGCYAKTNFIDLVRSGGIEAFDKFMSENNNNSRNRWSLWRFTQFKKGDKVVVPLFEKEFAVCEITGEPTSVTKLVGMSLNSKSNMPLEISPEAAGIIDPNNGRSFDIGFVVPVEILNKVPRSYADAKLISRMKIRQTNANIDELASSVEAAVTAREPKSLHDAIIEASKESIRNVLMEKVTPDTFERVIKWYMEQMGADNVYIPPKNERGKENGADADVVAYFYDLGLEFYIQAKKHEGTTGVWSVQQISEYTKQKKSKSSESNDNTCISWVISTADDFDQNAIESAQDEGVRLINGSEFAEMLMNCGINSIDEVVVKR